MASADVMGRVWALGEAVAAELGLELVDLEGGGGRRRQTIRLFVDKPGGVGLADCEAMSRRLAERLEEEDFIEFSYVLEVSSPGLERPLRRPGDFKRYLGHRVVLRLREQDETTGSRKISGVLKEVRNEEVIRVDTGGGEIREFPLSGIFKANLEVDWDTVFREKTAPDVGDFSGGVDSRRDR